MRIHLSIRQRKTLKRAPGYVLNPIAAYLRTKLGREQHHTIGGIPIVLPPYHGLPFYQRRDPTYDTYASELLARLAGSPRPVGVIDVGANVGDTAAMILSSAPNTTVVSVEGGPSFLPYLHRNLEPHSPRASIVEGFVGPIGNNVEFAKSGSTGGFHQQTGNSSPSKQSWVSVDELLTRIDRDHMAVWKCDIDGFDIELISTNWEILNERCDAIWFEYDTPRMLGDTSYVQTLAQQIAESGRTVLVYDNIGRRMLRVQPGDTTALTDLDRWLRQQYEGHITVPYLDLWALTPTALNLIESAS